MKSAIEHYLAVKQYLSEIGRKGGQARSERKTEACRENAKRPRPRPRKEKDNV